VEAPAAVREHAERAGLLDDEEAVAAVVRILQIDGAPRKTRPGSMKAPVTPVEAAALQRVAKRCEPGAPAGSAACAPPAQPSNFGNIPFRPPAHSASAAKYSARENFCRGCGAAAAPRRSAPPPHRLRRSL
jgi:hypothetical protein